MVVGMSRPQASSQSVRTHGPCQVSCSTMVGVPNMRPSSIFTAFKYEGFASHSA